MKRRNHWILFVILLLSLTILSPSFDISNEPVSDQSDAVTDPFYNPAPQTPQKELPLQITVSMGEEEYDIFQQLSQDAAEVTGTEIEIHNIEPNDEYKTLSDNFRLGESSDIILLDNQLVQSIAMQGYLRPITGNDPSGTAAEPFSSLLRMSEWNGYRWAVPLDIDPYVYAENRMDDPTAAPLQSNSTYDEWITRMNTWSEADAKPFYLDVDDPLAYASWLKFQGVLSEVTRLLNAEEFDDELRSRVIDIQTLVTFIETEFRDSEGELQWHAGIVKLSDLLPDYREDIASYINNDVESQALAVTGRSFALSSRTAQTEKATEWIKAMTSPESARIWFERSGKLPIYKSLYEELDMRDITTAVPVQALEQSLESSYGNESFDPVLLQEAKLIIEQFLRGEIQAEDYNLQMESIILDKENNDAQP